MLFKGIELNGNNSTYEETNMLNVSSSNSTQDNKEHFQDIKLDIHQIDNTSMENDKKVSQEDEQEKTDNTNKVKPENEPLNFDMFVKTFFPFKALTSMQKFVNKVGKASSDAISETFF